MLVLSLSAAYFFSAFASFIYPYSSSSFATAVIFVPDLTSYNISVLSLMSTAESFCSCEHPEIIKKDKRIREWAGEKELILENSLGEQIIYPSRNHLLEKFGIWGLKTGFHNLSGYNIIVTSKKGNVEIVAVVLGEVTDAARTKLLTEEFQAIEAQLTIVKKAGSDMGEFKLKDGKKKTIKGTLAEDVYEVKNNPYEYETRDLNIKAPV
mgnify:CR=1 FL=1